MKTSLASLGLVLAAQISAFSTASAAEELNEYCDPIDTMYLGGTPLYNWLTGESISLEDYLAQKGLDENCEPLEDASEFQKPEPLE